MRHRCEGPRCARDPDGWENGAKGPEKVANAVPGRHPSAKRPGPQEPWSSEEAGWRGLPGPASSGNTRPASEWGWGGADKEGAPGGPDSGRADIYNNNVWTPPQGRWRCAPRPRPLPPA